MNDSNTIRIGQFFHIATYIGGIYQRSYGVSGLAVFVDQNGKLGTQVSSSRRFKQDIRDMNEDSDGLMKLRPVTFRYKPELDPTGHTQHGLIAEEVADVYPSLVVYDPDGQPNSVSYHVIPVLLLNEVQKQRRAIQELEERLAKLEARLTTEP